MFALPFLSAWLLVGAQEVVPAPTGQEPGPVQDVVATRLRLLDHLSKIERALVLLEGSGGERERRLVDWALSELNGARALARRANFEPQPTEDTPPVPGVDPATDAGAAAVQGGPPAEDGPGAAPPGSDVFPPLPPQLAERVSSGELPSPATLRIPRPSKKVVLEWGTGFTRPLMRDEWHASVPGSSGKHALLSEGVVLSEPLEPLRVERCWLDGSGSTSVRWGIIAHGAKDWTFRRCLFRDIPDEHGLYLKSCWDLSFERCRFENIGSQAIQVVWRDHEAATPGICVDPYGNGRPAVQRVTECVFLEVGQPTGGRPSYALSFFEREPPTTPVFSDVLVERCWLESQRYANQAMDGGPYYSYGAIMVHGRNRVVLDSNVVRYRRPNRAIVQIWNCAEVVLRGGDYSEGLIDIRNCPKVTLAGLTGNAQVQVADGPLYTAPSSGELQVVHRGPVTQDWSR